LRPFNAMSASAQTWLMATFKPLGVTIEPAS